MRYSLFLFFPIWASAGVVSLDNATVKRHSKGAEIRFLATPGENGTKSAFMGHLTVPPGGKVPLHRDSTEEYIYILEGAGTLWIDKKKYAVKPGSAIYMPAGAEVRFENGSSQLKAIQFFAPSGPEVKYKTWSP